MRGTTRTQTTHHASAIEHLYDVTAEIATICK